MKQGNINLPQIYKRNNKEYYLDPIREKLILITPEETVRQKVISYLINCLKVPKESIAVEQHLSHYGIKTQKRADIVVHKIGKDNVTYPICVIECKAENVYLDDYALNQLLEYCDLIEADYAILNNGIEQAGYKYDEEKKQYIEIDDIPTYPEMLKGQFMEIHRGELPPRIPFEQLESFLLNEFSSYEEGFYGYEISSQTPIKMAVPIFNFWECMLDTRVKLPVGKYELFELIEDYGVRMLSYGNGGGGIFYGPYRSFLVSVNGNVEFYSISVTTYSKTTNLDKVKTCICVAHDDEESTHHALQLVVDDNLQLIDDEITFYHNGRIAVGRKGSGKISELRQYVADRYPKIIDGNKFNLGKLRNNKLWRLDDPEVIEVIVNLISYAMIRDEYREYAKQR